MTDFVDNEARDRVAKLYTEHRELAADYWGPNKDNGKRSLVLNVHERLTEIEETVERRHQTRQQDCLGLAAVREYLANAKQEDGNVKIEKLKGSNMMAIQVVQLIGILAVALIAAFK